MSSNPISDRIREARIRQDLTQAEAAARAQLDTRTWRAYEGGRTPRRLHPVAQALGTTSLWLRTGEKSTPPDGPPDPTETGGLGALRAELRHLSREITITREIVTADAAARARALRLLMAAGAAPSVAGWGADDPYAEMDAAIADLTAAADEAEEDAPSSVQPVVTPPADAPDHDQALDELWQLVERMRAEREATDGAAQPAHTPPRRRSA